jgi:hypothetical protein
VAARIAQVRCYDNSEWDVCKRFGHNAIGLVNRVLIIGTGALARNVCQSLAAMSVEPIDVVVVSRSAERGAALCFGANGCAVVSRTQACFRAVTADVLSASLWPKLLAEVKPDLVLSCVSLHEPREETSASEWTRFVRRAGFGVTLPLQAVPAVLVGRALTETAADAIFVNACFPDLVNPLLRALGLPICCGIGNGSLVAVAIQAALHLPDQRQLRVLAHHRHLYGVPADADARAWHAGQELTNVSEVLAPMREADRTDRNLVSGRAAARLLLELLGDGVAYTSAPGPGGLPGGYSVRIAQRRVEVELPPGIDLDDAVAWNRRQCLMDGVDVTPSGQVRFAPAAGEELWRELPELADGFRADDTLAACKLVLGLRRRLRGEARPTSVAVP